MYRHFACAFSLAACLVLAEESTAQGPQDEPVAPGTGIEMWAGFRYQSGETVESDLVSIPADGVFALELLVHHEANVFDRLWRAELELGIDTFLQESSEDYDVATVRVGRVFEGLGPWRLFTALAGEYAAVGYEPFYGGAALWLAADCPGPQSVRWLHARVGREEYSSTYEGSDAWVADGEVGMGIDDLLVKEATAWIGPALRYNHAESSRLRYTQIDLETEYVLPLSERWSFSLDAAASRYFYSGHEETLSSDRRDWYLITGGSLWLERLFTDSLALEVRYEYERNWSNDRLERYQSHNPGIYVHWAY